MVYFLQLESAHFNMIFDSVYKIQNLHVTFAEFLPYICFYTRVPRKVNKYIIIEHLIAVY